MFCKTCNDISDAGTSGTFGWRQRRPRNARCPSRTSFPAPGTSRTFPPVLLSCFQHSCSLHPGTSSGSRLKTLMASATKARSPIRLMSTNQLLVSQSGSPWVILSHSWIYLMWTNFWQVWVIFSHLESSWVWLKPIWCWRKSILRSCCPTATSCRSKVGISAFSKESKDLKSFEFCCCYFTPIAMLTHNVS